MTDTKKQIDWPSIRNDWDKSDWSIRRMADWYQVSEAAIRKKAKQESWPERTCAPKEPVRTAEEPRTPPVIMAGIDATDPEQIVGRGHNLIFRLLDELDATTTYAPQLEEMIQAHEDDQRRQYAMLKAVSLSSRAGVVKAFATAFKTWNEAKATEGIKAKRQAAAEAISSGGRFAPEPR